MQMLGIIYDFWQAISGISGGITALGFAGSFVGGIDFRFIGLRSSGLIGEILVSVVGACIVIFVAGYLGGKK